MDQQTFQFLERYINNPSPTGFERKGQKMWLDYLMPYIDDHYMDNYNNAVGIINPEHKYKIMLESHGDEISWLVNYIGEKGFLHVIPNGGADADVCPGKRALIHTNQGILPCVFGWPPIHLRYDMGNFRVDENHLFVVCGCSSVEEVKKLGIRVGDVITFDDQLQIINKRFLVGRGLDNRIGALIIAEVARRLKESNKKLPFALYFVNAVQEEVGLNGAKMISDQIKPDIAIVTDVTHDTNIPFIDIRKHGDTCCGKGPVLAIAPAIHKGLLQVVQNVANENKIPFQFVAVSRETSTDADAIALAQGGICSVLISPPLRYMHTPVEMVCSDDIENTIKLMTELMKKIDPATINLNSAFNANELG
mgnify:FL=1